MLFGTTALAVANDASHKSKTRHLQNMAPERYNAAPYQGSAPGAGFYNYAPGPGGYYRDRDNWSAAPNVDFSPGPDPYIGTPYDNVFPY
jgi:hypothetical protein